MANEFIARNGLISQNNSVVTGSLTVTQGITGSLLGTSSVSTNITVTNDSSTNATFYPIFSPSSSGAIGARVDTTTLSYNPSTNTLTTADLTLAATGNRILTMQADTAGGTEIKLLPNFTGGHARINVGNTNAPLDFQMNSANVMRIAQNGNVGIGTTTPSARLDVSGSVNISGSLLVGTGSILTTSTFYGFTPNLVVGMNTGSSGGVLDLRNTSTSTVAGNTVGTIQFSALGDGTAYPSSQIRSTVTDNVGSGNTGGGNISIWTSFGYGSPVERMRVRANGQVLIGLTSSLDTTSKLIVNGSTAITGSTDINGNTAITGSLTSTATTLLNTLSGNTAVGLSTDTTTARLQVRGTGATSATNTLILQNSSLTNLLTVRDDGLTTLLGPLLVGTGSLSTAPVYGLTPNLSVSMNTGSTGAVLDLKNTSGSIVAGDTLGTIQFSALSVGGTYNVASSQIRATSVGAPTLGSSGGGNLSFWTSPTSFGGNLITERMRVNSNGQLLIGLTSSLDTTSKLIVSGSTAITGSLAVSQGITGSLFGTSSWSDNATTASYVLNAESASYVLQAVSSSFATTASYVLQAVSSSFATTASYALNGGVTQIVAGTNVTISPTNGLGAVTINSTGGGGSGGTDLGLVQAMTVGLQNIF